MKRYEKYKEVDLPWLKEVPEHWEKIKIKDLLEKQFSGVWGTDNINYIKLKCIRITNFNHESLKIKNDNFTYRGYTNQEYQIKKLFVGDILIEKSGGGDKTPVGRVVYNDSYSNTMCSNFIQVLRPIKSVNNKFLAYILYSIYIRNTVWKYIKKSTGIQNLDLNNYLNQYVVIPFISEQIKIVSFLDWKISEIDKLIDLEKSKIEKLEEYKKNIFSFLMKNEKEYKVISLKNILKIKNIKKSQIDRELNLLSVVRDKGIILRSLDEEDENHNVIPEDLSNYKVVYKNDFVMNKMKAWQGSYGISKLEGVVSPAYFVFEFKNKDILKDFFHLSIRCREYIDEFAKYSKGIRVGQWDFDLKEIKNIYFKYPSLDRQNYIMNKVKTIYQNIDEIISKTNNQITYLQELKQTLISDVVTGKIDVRHIEIPKK